MDAAAKTKADAMDAPFAKTSLKLEGKELLKQAGKQAAVGAGLGALVGGGISAATDGDALQGAAWCAFSGGAGSFSRGIFVNRFKASSQALSASSHNAKTTGKIIEDRTASSSGSSIRVRNHFDATTLTDAQVDKAIAKSIRRHSGATGNASREIVATGDQVESMLNMMTTWRRNVHAANPNLASLPAEVKGTLLHSSVAKRMRDLNISGLRVNERLYGTSKYISPATGRPYEFRIVELALRF